MKKFTKTTLALQNIAMLITFLAAISTRTLPSHMAHAQFRFETAAAIIALIGILLIAMLTISCIIEVHLLNKRKIEYHEFKKRARISIVLALFVILLSLCLAGGPRLVG